MGGENYGFAIEKAGPPPIVCLPRSRSGKPPVDELPQKGSIGFSEGEILMLQHSRHKVPRFGGDQIAGVLRAALNVIGRQDVKRESLPNLI